jgi:energy-coupling factor transport system permease protein
MKSVVIGQYVPGTGFFYKLDPRTKIMAVLFIMIAIFMLQNITQLLIAFGIALLGLLAGRISLLKIIKGLKPIFFLLVFTFIFQIALNKDGRVLVNDKMYLTVYSILFIVLAIVLWRFVNRYVKYKITLFLAFAVGVYFILKYVSFGYQLHSFSFVVYEGGITMSLFVIVRLLIIITLSTVLTLTTKPTDLTQAIEQLLHPLKKIGFHSEDFALIISISLRYIPTIFDEANKIMMAQASRGADFSEGKLKDKLKQIISLLVPMFIIAFIRSEELADAMESRNFVPGKTRTRINVLKFSMVDVYTAIFTLVFFGLAIYVKVA